jgi:hypothetical protein
VWQVGDVPLTPTAIDFETITRELAEAVRTRAPQRYDRGRARMSDVVMRSLACTATRARHIVSALVERGYVRFGPHPTFTTPDVGQWTYHPQAEARG